MPRTRWILWYAIVLHSIWALLLLVSDTPKGATPLGGFAGIPHLWLAGLLVAAVAPAVWAVRRWPSQWTLLAVLPQQAVLVVSAWSATAAMVGSHYADGVIRSQPFIIADQTPVVLTMLLHTAAVIEMHVVHRSPAPAGRWCQECRYGLEIDPPGGEYPPP